MLPKYADGRCTDFLKITNFRPLFLLLYIMVFVLLLTTGFVLLVYGADRLVDGASSLAKRYRIPDIVIGLTIVAFGTSAPEMAINIVAATKGNTDLVLGNVLGSNIFNVLAILGISALIFPLSVNKDTVKKEIPFSLFAAILVLILALVNWSPSPGK